MWQKPRNEETWKTIKCRRLLCSTPHRISKYYSALCFVFNFVYLPRNQNSYLLGISLHRLYQDPYVCLLQPNCACILSQLGSGRPRMFHTTRHGSTYNENECVLQICPLWSWRGNCSMIYKKQNLGASCEMSVC